MSRKMSTANLDFMGNVMNNIFISDMQYPAAAEIDFVHAMYRGRI